MSTSYSPPTPASTSMDDRPLHPADHPSVPLPDLEAGQAQIVPTHTVTVPGYPYPIPVRVGYVPVVCLDGTPVELDGASLEPIHISLPPLSSTPVVMHCEGCEELKVRDRLTGERLQEWREREQALLLQSEEAARGLPSTCYERGWLEGQAALLRRRLASLDLALAMRGEVPRG